MKAVIRFIKDLFSAPFQGRLVFAFTLIAAITIGIGTWVISGAINSYLTTAMNERVSRDIHLASTFYEIKLREIAGIADRLSLSATVIANLDAAKREETDALEAINTKILVELGGVTFGGTHVVAILDPEGNVLSGEIVTVGGERVPIVVSGNWAALPILQQAKSEQSPFVASEVIPVELLRQVGLAEQARVELVDTPKAAPTLFDPREGSAGLVIASAAPIMNSNHQLAGLVLAFYLFNNDFTLVDQIRDAAQIDTVTIFLGDLRVSTNVMTAEGQRAVGTRLAQDVGEVVLYGGSEYIGPAFVVNEQYITCYRPLRDFNGKIVGILYVGARQASFLRLLNTFNQRITLVTILTIMLAFAIAIPVSRAITRPLKELKELAQTSARVAEGDLSARASIMAGGVVGQVARSFNNMLDTLHATQIQLVHKEKLASLGQLAAGVAHELNNPLATVLLYSDVLLHECAPKEPHRADLEAIVRETQRCKGIVAALLDFARQHQLNVEELDLNNLIQSIIEVEKKHALFINVKIVTEFGADMPQIQADPAQLEAVFVNLITNAAEAMPEGGTLTLRTRSGPAGLVTVEVADTGTGISPENLTKIFTPFFTTKKVGKGTGLGLAISYGIVKMHRGQINIQSEVGKGTTFIVILPIRLPNLGTPSAPPNIQPANDKKMIG